MKWLKKVKEFLSDKDNKKTTIRLSVFALAIINQILVMFGLSPLPLDEATINAVVVQLDVVISTVFTAIVSVWSTWKDNPVSKKARDEKKAVKDMKEKGDI